MSRFEVYSGDRWLDLSAVKKKSKIWDKGGTKKVRETLKEEYNTWTIAKCVSFKWGSCWNSQG